MRTPEHNNKLRSFDFHEPTDFDPFIWSPPRGGSFGLILNNCAGRGYLQTHIIAGDRHRWAPTEKARDEVREHIRPQVAAYTAGRRAEGISLGITGDAEETLTIDNSLDRLPFAEESLFDEENPFNADLEESSLDLQSSCGSTEPVGVEGEPTLGDERDSSPPRRGVVVTPAGAPATWSRELKGGGEARRRVAQFTLPVDSFRARRAGPWTIGWQIWYLTYQPIIQGPRRAMKYLVTEMQEDLDGTLEELETLCAENRNIKRSEEGRLKRFGMRFHALVKKLSKAPAIILNTEACRRYLDALERGFAETLRMATNTRNLIKEDLLQAGGNAPPIEWRDAQLEELGGELFGLRNMLAVIQKQSKAMHEELLKVFQNARSPAPTQGESEQRDSGIRSGPQTAYSTDHHFNRGYGGQVQRNGCYYCEGQDHYSKECSVKAAHINKGWLVVEDGQQKLSDGNYIPRGRGQKTSTIEQHLNEMFYGGPAEDEFDVLRDEIRTLRAKLNQVASGGPSMFQPTPAPVMQLQAQVNPYTNQAAPVPPVNMEELGRTVFNMMRASNYMQDQYIQTRSKARNVAFAEPPEQDF
ncbi:hypothetical protein B0H14DRAFT_2559433 [Mycena olivaceomarginata]|nr:hypothetical protein B0H14DRAFT_2559433 [Mycena olivaceomarginata]